MSLVHYFRKHAGPGGGLAIRALLVVAVTPRLALALARRDRALVGVLRSILGVALAPQSAARRAGRR